jgi:PAS domain S-box-containing protein
VVVDDAPEVRALVKARLRTSGRFRVVGEGADGHEAVDLARRLQPALMLLDVSMPRMDGLEALPEILLVSPGTRVVMYSGFEDRDLAETAVRFGAVGYLEKAQPIEELPAMLDAMLYGIEPVESTEPAAPGGIAGAAQRVLDDHLERFREVFYDAAIGMATMTMSGRLVRVNRVLAELLGDEPERFVGLPYESLLAADAKAELAAGLAELGAGGERRVVGIEHGLAGSRGPRWVRSTLVPVLDSLGRPLYLFLQLQDLSAELAAAEVLHVSEARFRLLVEAVQDYAIFMLDPTGHIASWNAGAQRIKGYTASEIIGRHFRVFYPPEQQASRHPEHELEIALREGRYEEEGWRIRKDGSRFWALVVITAVHDADGNHIGFGKVTRDVTERRMLLEELEQANERLARAAAEQSAFLGISAHELRGPIAVMSGAADLLAEHGDELTAEERQDLRQSIRSSRDRLRRLLGDLVTVSRLEAGRMELVIDRVTVRAALHAATAAAVRQHGDLAVEIACDPALTVAADPDRLAQMLDNLVSNALQHGAPPLRLSASKGAGAVQIRVEDSGAGVAEEFLPELFRRFSTGPRGTGTGLGLYIVRELARAQHGDAWYEPPAGAGPAFVLRLPVAVPNVNRRAG